MSHYFSNDNDTLKSNPTEIAFSVNGISLKLTSDNGVFSKSDLDRGTRVLLETIELEENKTALDLGCGYGPVGIYLNQKFKINSDMVDINERAIRLSKINVQKYKINNEVFLSDGFTNITKKYDYIITNPPIRTGKENVYRLLTDAKDYLLPSGALYVVINKKHGAESAIKKLNELYHQVVVLNRKKGFYVIECKI
ncbi:hypothetical protein CI105_00405 [Candidatus Izimaplasma bacterium ZiA1]|uniref:class I SAM-dependent methyltransferase n=1 Tax=Candidatus Izimoplasma sp. ZiA1 TaxID=2024899 RepID=UPI000BAA3EAD|nr:hypothetical protein CI105_00405 [Candidatus Izimaplasma bacterium ZiA1]